MKPGEYAAGAAYIKPGAAGPGSIGPATGGPGIGIDGACAPGPDGIAATGAEACAKRL